MIGEAKNYKITIFGDQYTLATDESEEHIIQTTRMLDAIMKEIAQASKLQDSKKVAVLAGLRLASQLVALQTEQSAVNAINKKLIDQIDRELFLRK
jgi:cell division protein ZapA (FtsZ GTPase activity inhibitor)